RDEWIQRDPAGATPFFVRGRVLRPTGGSAVPLQAKVGGAAPVAVTELQTFTVTLDLPDGVHEVPVVVTSAPGERPRAEGRTTHLVRVDRSPPRLLVTWPPDDLRTGAAEVRLRARVVDLQPWVEVRVDSPTGQRVVRL